MKREFAARLSYAAVVVLGLVVAVVIVTRSQRASTPGTLAFEPAEIDLRDEDTAFIGDAIRKTLWLRNTTGSAVIVESVSSSCSCSTITIVSGKSLPLECPNNGEVECAAIIEPPQSPGTVGIEFTAIGRLQGEQVSTTATILVRGENRISGDPPVISLGELDPVAGNQTVDVVLLRHRNVEPIGIKTIDTPQESGIRLYAMHLLKMVEADGQGRIPYLRLTLSIDPTLVPHKLSDEVVVHLDNGELLRIPILGWGSVDTATGVALQ